jgi:ABC-2 type transport system permease protein
VYVLLRVIVKEFQQLKRDRRILPILFVAPAVQIMLFGYAVNTDVRDIPTVLVDLDRTPASRELWDRFEASGYFEQVGVEDSTAAIDAWLVGGRAQMALVIARGYGEAVAAGRAPEVGLMADGSDASSSVVGLGYASGVLGRAASDLLAARVASLLRATPAGGAAREAAGRIDLVPRVWYNPDLRSRWFYVPAVLALVLMSTTLILSAMGVVREKEIGTLEQVLVTPIRPWQLIIGKLSPFLAVGLVDTFIVVAIVVGWFRVPLRGSLATLLGLTLLFILTNLGLGLLASTLVRNQQQAMMGATFLLMMPMIYLSGLIFPIENMPTVIRWFTYAIPLRYYAICLRGVFLKGSGIAVLWPEAAAMSGFALGVLLLASLRFQKRLG